MADPNSPVTRFTIWRASLPPAIRLLLTINVATYLAFVVLAIVGADGLALWIAIPPEAGQILYQPWAVLTHAFANNYVGFFGLISFAFALMWLNWIGRDLEETYGSHQIFGLYILSALAAAGTGLLWLSLRGGLLPIFGAWTAVGAIIVYAAVMNPQRGIGMLFLGVISMKWIAIAFIALDLAFAPMTWKAAHVGAYLVGALFGVLQKRGIELGAWARPLFGRGGARRPMPRPSFGGASGGWGGGGETGVATRTRAERTPRRTSAARSAPSEPTQADVDRILEKIHEKGLDSLSKEERRILEKWSGSA